MRSESKQQYPMLCAELTREQPGRDGLPEFFPPVSEAGIREADDIPPKGAILGPKPVGNLGLPRS